MAEQRYLGIQMLRGFAAFLVLSAHANYLVGAPPPAAASIPLNGGAVGVDIFFVISGFVIAMTTDNRRKTPRAFLADRMMRVLPLYYIASAPFILLKPLEFEGLWNTYFLAPIFDSGGYSNPAHRFGWTIALEVWFYLLFACAMALRPRNACHAFAAAILTAIIAAALYPGAWTGARFFGMPLAAEFLAGIAIFKWRKNLGLRFALAALTAGPLLLAISMWFFPFVGKHELMFGTPGLAFVRLFAWGAPAALIVAGFVAAEQAGRLPKAPALVWFGDISYSFYLAQPFALLALAGAGLEHWFVVWAAMFATTLPIAAISYQFIEKPVAAVWKRRSRRRRENSAAQRAG